MAASARHEMAPVGTGAQASTHEDIQRRAYHNWEERQKSGTPGSALEDWIKAEHDMKRHDRVEEASEESFPASDSPAW